MLTDVQIAIEATEFIHGPGRVSKRRFSEWQRSDDPDVLGALYWAAAHHWSRIDPSISRDDLERLLVRLTRATLNRPGKTMYGLTDHAAVRTYCGFMAECYKNRADPDADACLKLAVRNLGTLYRNASVPQRRCLVDAGIEHLFEQPGMQTYFERWRRDKILAKAFYESLEWARGSHTEGELISDPAAGGKRRTPQRRRRSKR
jgi:hypothetical protein